MYEYIFDYEGKKYITDAETQLDAEVKFEEEFGEQAENVKVINNFDELIYTEEDISYF